MKSKFWWVAAATLAIVLVGQFAYVNLNQRMPTAHAVWAFQPKNFSEVADKATVIAEAQVVAVAKGKDIVTGAKDEPEGINVVPTQYITFKVLKGQKNASEGQILTVFRTGGETYVPVAEPEGKGDSTSAPVGTKVKVLLLDDDPAYNVGDRHFLLLEAGPDNTLRPVSPEGRYLIKSDGTLAAVSSSEVAQSVNGRSAAEMEQAATAK